MDDSPIGSLPGEIRHRVYEYTLTTDHPLIVHLGGDPDQIRRISVTKRHLEDPWGNTIIYPHALALTCRQAYYEAMGLFYTRIKIEVRIVPFRRLPDRPTPDPFHWLILRTLEALKYVPKMISARHLSCLGVLTIEPGCLPPLRYHRLFDAILVSSIKPQILNFQIGRIEIHEYNAFQEDPEPFHDIVDLDEVPAILLAACSSRQTAHGYTFLVSITSFWAYVEFEVGKGGPERNKQARIGDSLRIDTTRPLEEASRLDQLCNEVTNEWLLLAYEFLAQELRMMPQQSEGVKM